MLDRAADPDVDVDGVVFLPNEKVLLAARSEKAGCDSGMGEIGRLHGVLGFSRDVLSGEPSGNEGNVEEELKRAEDDEVSHMPPLEDEL